MAKTRSVAIGDRLGALIERQVGEGHYSSARDGARRLGPLGEREMAIEALRAALIDGEQSGASTPFDAEAFIRRKREDL